MESGASRPVRAAFSGFVDYAGLFPPAERSLPEAADEYESARSGAAAWMLGRFVIQGSRVREAAAVFAETAPLSVIADVPLERIAALRRDEPRLGVEALEVAIPALKAARDTFDAPIGQFAAMRAHAALDGLPAYVEVPRDARWSEALPSVAASLARHRLGGKLRCGGLTADAVPSCAQVAAFVLAMASERVTFKATAGLHHPVRGRDPVTGFVMHGFVNLLVAALAAHAGAIEEVEPALAEEDPCAFAFDDDALRWRDLRFDAAQIEAVRRSAFAGYGSCSFAEPVEGLTEMDVLRPARA